MIFRIRVGFISSCVIHSLSCFTQSSAKATTRPVSLRLHVSCRRKTQQCGCVSAGLSICVWERRISWMGAVNLSNTCSLDSGAWCEVSSARYPIDHIYCIHHSASLFWQLIAPGKASERIGFLFERQGMLLAWVVSLHFSVLWVFRERSVTDVGAKAPL